MRHALGTLAATLVLGCSPRPPAASQPKPASVSVPTATVAETRPAPKAEATAAAPLEIREPADVACRISDKEWRSEQLRLEASGPRFARTAGVPASVVLPVTESPSAAIAVMDDGEVLVRAVLARADVELYAAKPTPLLGVVTPAAKTTLQWTSSSTGKVRIGLDTSRVLRTPKPFLVDVGCTALGVVPSEYDAKQSITKTKNLTLREVVKDGAPLAPGPKAKPVAELNQGLVVELVEMRGGRARILVDEQDYVVSGWVSQKDLGSQSLVGGLYGVGLPRGEYGRTQERLYLMHCPHDVALFVQLGSGRAEVGLVRKDTGFRSIPDEESVLGGFRPIELPENGWLGLEQNARLLVRSADLADCRQETHGF